MKNVVGLFLVLVSTFLFFPSAGFAEEHERGSWYIGFGLGAAPTSPSFTVNGGSSGTFRDALVDDSGAIALNFKVGATLSEKSLLGLDITSVNQTSKMAPAGGTNPHLGITNLYLMYTYFPYTEGLLFRLGGGINSFAITPALGSNQSVGGYGVLGGIGYAFWIGKAFNLTLNADYSLQQYSGSTGQPSSSNFIATYVGFDWY